MIHNHAYILSVYSEKNNKNKRNIRFIEEFNKRNITCSILNPSKINLFLTKNNCKIINENIHDSAYIIPSYSFRQKINGGFLLKYFESKPDNYTIINSLKSINLARDKFESLFELSLNSIPVPDTLLSSIYLNSIEQNKLFNNENTLLKLLNGSQGTSVIYPVSENIQKYLHENKNQFIIQKFIKESSGKDIRVFVLNNKIIGSYLRNNIDDFRSNIHCGGVASYVELTDEEKDISIKSANILGLNMAGVDLLRTNNGPMVIEVNANPGIEGLEKYMNINVVSMVVDYLIDISKTNIVST